MTIIAPNRQDAVVDDSGRMSLRLADVVESLVNTSNQLVINADEDVTDVKPYTTENVTEGRDLDASAADILISDPPTQEEVETIRDAVLDMADVLGTLVADLQAAGIIA